MRYIETLMSLIKQFNSFSIDFIVLFASAIISEQIIVIIGKKKSGVLMCLLYIIGYVFSFSFTSFFFILVRHYTVGTDIVQGWLSYNRYMIHKNMLSIVIVPLFVRLISASGENINQKDDGETYIGNIGHGWSKFWRCIIVAVSVGVVIVFPFSPIEQKSYTRNDIPEMVFIPKFLSSSKFVSYADNGYYSESKVNTPSSDSDYSQLPDKPIEQMSFHELITATAVYYKWGQNQNAVACLERAYSIYLNGAVDLLDSDIGMMWWYKGYYENDGECYYRAGRIFETIENHYNAAVSFEPAYELRFTGPEKAMEHYIWCIENNESVSTAIEFVLNVFNNEETIPYFNQFISLLPNNLCLSMADIWSHVDNMSEKDLRMINEYLAMEQYRDCPKLLITKGYYNIIHGAFYDLPTEKLCYLLENHYDYFDKDDLINTAWLLCYPEKYDKAISIFTSWNSWNELPEASMAVAAVYLNDSSVVSEWMIEDAYIGLINGAAEFSEKYNSERVLKYELIKTYLSNSLGYDKNSNVEIAKELRNENYRKTIELCNELISSSQATNATYEMLTEAYISIACESEQPDKEKYLELAEKAALEIKNNSEPDYIQSMELLKKIYEMMGNREEEHDKINEVLRVLD